MMTYELVEESVEKQAKILTIELEPTEAIKPISNQVSLKASFIQFCAIGFAALLGAYIRVGISYYRIWKTETNYVSIKCHFTSQDIYGLNLLISCL